MANFFSESLKNIKTVGTLTRSSKFVCRKMVSQVDFSTARTIVELGAGDGVITKHILAAMAPDARLLSFEVLPKMCELLRRIKDDRLTIVQDSAEYLGKHLEEMQLPKADAVISAIPFVAFSEEVSYRIVEAVKEQMKPGAPFIQLHYSLLTKKMYENVFGGVNVHFVPLNAPPAFVLVSYNLDFATF